MTGRPIPSEAASRDPATKRPRGPVFPAGALLIGATLVTASLAYAAWEMNRGEPTPDPSPTLASRPLLFEDRADGAVVVRDGIDESEIEVFGPGTNGFVRGAMRGLARERRKHGVGREVPFELVLREDGRLQIADPVTNARIDLVAFGPSNVAPFARILETTGSAR